MTDKVQKIREEVERIQLYTQSEVLKQILDFIDSLQEEPEPQFKVGDTIRSKHWHMAVHKITSMDDKAYHLDNGGKVDLSSQQLWELVEEPVSEDLDKAAGNYAFTMSGEDEVSKYYAFKAGAKWQEDKDMELTWEDIGKIISIDQQICGTMGISDYIDNHQQAMKEVLKRFNKERKNNL